MEQICNNSNLMNIFITGATGYLGYHFAKMALMEGHRVLCLRRPTSVSLFEPEEEELIQWVNNDDEAKLRETVGAFHPDVLFHAAWGGVRGAAREDVAIQHANIEMSRNLFVLYPYKQIIALGSQSEYGYYEGPVSEEHPLNPTMQYAKAKVQSCELLKEYAGAHSIEWQWIRIFTVFGEKLTGGLIKVAAEACLSGQQEFNTSEGLQRYSYMYAADYAKAICNIIGVRDKSGIYNLSQSADVYSNREILEMVKELTESKIDYHFGALPYPTNQVMYMDGKVDKFVEAFGAIPRTEFKHVLLKTIESIKV